MAIRWRVDGNLICAAMSEPREDDIYISDHEHYLLSVLTKTIIADDEHKINGLWHWKFKK